MKRLKKPTSAMLIAVMLLSNTQSLIAYANEDNLPKYKYESTVDKTSALIDNSEIKSEEVVNIPDLNLKRKLNNKLNQSSNSDITRKQLESFNFLDLSNENIRNLEGLQYCSNLERLFLHQNPITDLTPLSNLTKLEALGLVNIRTNNITPLANLTNLQELSLGGNGISDIGALSNLINLKWLSLNDNKISDINSLSNLVNLQELSLGGNEISNIGSLTNLTNLQLLSMSQNNISNIESLKGLINLQTLSLDSNNISDISSLSKLINLKSLTLDNNEISNINSLSNLTDLEMLMLGRNNISDISGLSNLNNVKYVYLTENEISDLSGLRHLTNLETLSLDYNNISDISSLSNLTNLQDLSLGGNEISEIDSLSNLTSLKNLSLYDNEIEDITALSYLYGLEHLSLVNNRISDISELSYLPNLRYVGLENQRITMEESTVVDNTLKLVNPVKSIDGNTIRPDNISDLGSYDEKSNTVIWNNIETNLLCFSFYERVYIGYTSAIFSGNVNQPVKTNEVPIIKGADDLSIKKDDKFDYMYGVTAKDREDGDITYKIIVTGHVDTSTPGVYVLNYEVIDNDGNIVTKERKVTVRSNEKPEIIAEDLILNVGDEFEPMKGVTSNDKEDGDITSDINIIENTVNTSKPGTYKVVYEVSDSDGNKVSKTIKVEVVKTIQFNDVLPSHWAYKEIMDFAQRGYVNGSDGKFRPNDSITRAEFVKIVNKTFGYNNAGIENYSDVNAGAWYYNEVCIAVGAGYIDANQAKFRPNDPITREEAAAIITSIQKCKDDDLDKIKTYTDYNKVSSWALSSVEGAIEKGYMGVGSKEFRPKANITRAEAVVTLYRVIN